MIIFKNHWPNPPNDITYSVSLFCQCIFLFSCVWSLGASIDARGRKDFDKVLREIVEVNKSSASLCTVTYIESLHVFCPVVILKRGWRSGSKVQFVPGTMHFLSLLSDFSLLQFSLQVPRILSRCGL